MRILVTGGAGFIGRHLMARLQGEKHHVIGFDDLSTSPGPAGPDIDVGDVSDFREIDGCIARGFDVLYHLACPASPVHYQKDPIKTLETAFIGTSNVLRGVATTLERFGGDIRVILASTSEVYGDPLVSPQPESYLGNVPTVGDRSCYDEGKRAAESAAWAYRKQHRVDVRIARIFNTYGPGMAKGDGRLVPTLVCQALAGEPMTIKGDGSQKRSLCYVSDTVDGLIRIAGEERRDYLPVYNVGNPDERTVLQIATDIGVCVPELLRREMPFWTFHPADKDDPRQRCPDISRIQGALGWAPIVPLAEGLRRTVDYFRRLG
jgi:UDP-glucuronate decarboxylase